MKAEFNTDSLLTKLALQCVRVSVFYELSSSVTLVVTIQMQSIVPSREWSPGTSASHLRPSFLLSELQRGATLHKCFTFTHKPTDCGHKSTQRERVRSPESHLIPPPVLLHTVSGAQQEQRSANPAPPHTQAAFRRFGKNPLPPSYEVKRLTRDY